LKIQIAYLWDARSWDVDRGESVENLELESAEIECSLSKFGNMYLVESYSEQKTNFAVVDNEIEAVQSFKTELAYLLYEYQSNFEEADGREVAEAERVLGKYGFQEDMKNAYAILEASGGKVEDVKVKDLVREKYPKYDPDLVEIALSALKAKGYMEWTVENHTIYFTIAKKLDF
jgi:hypothetical protein